MSQEQIENSVDKWWKCIKYFRVGRFQDAQHDVQDAWLNYFCPAFVPVMNSAYRNKTTQANEPFSKFLNVSDEAYLTIMLEKNGDKFLTEHNDVQVEIVVYGKKLELTKELKEKRSVDCTEDDWIQKSKFILVARKADADCMNLNSEMIPVPFINYEGDFGPSWEQAYIDHITQKSKSADQSSVSPMRSTGTSNQDDSLDASGNQYNVFSAIFRLSVYNVAINNILSCSE